MNTYFKITVAIRLVFVLFAIAAYAVKLTPFNRAYIVENVSLDKATEPRTYVSSRTTYYSIIMTTEGKKFSIRKGVLREAFNGGDTIVAQSNILGKPVSFYKLNGAYVYPLSGPATLQIYFLLLGIFSLSSVVFGRRSRFETWQHSLLALSVMDVGFLILYCIA